MTDGTAPLPRGAGDGPRSVLDGLSDAPPPPLPGLEVLRALVADAAHRAAVLLDDPDGAPSGADEGVDDVTADVARFVARGGDAHLEAAAERLGVSPGRMRLLALAHRYGGRSAVATFLAPRPAAPDVLGSAEHAVQPLRPSPTAPVERHHNHLTDAPARVQLRYGPDLRWHPYVERYGTWQPAGEPCSDPAAAYSAARAALRASPGR
ncbi:hypothetical protein L1085_002640 [Streptomyces sp. MSC1_001]|jgi:hypothetical protein|uniref:hypothetical protein n=1 Tax=Streptomyces sp. MSC1_001 TaxID=2909263 RepID=UPI00202F8D18|nr:hypothetical protein [Streptomyces sp. MSC1_001]